MSQAKEVFADSEHSDIFSGKAVAGLAALGVVLMAFCGQLETLFDWPMIVTVNIGSMFLAIPYALNTFYSIADKKFLVRFFSAAVTLLIGWHTVFQATRGLNNSYANQAQNAPQFRGEMSTSGFSFEVKPDMFGFNQPPFRPVYQWSNGGYVVLVYNAHGQQVWMRSVQNQNSRRF